MEPTLRSSCSKGYTPPAARSSHAGVRHRTRSATQSDHTQQLGSRPQIAPADDRTTHRPTGSSQRPRSSMAFGVISIRQKSPNQNPTSSPRQKSDRPYPALGDGSELHVVHWMSMPPATQSRTIQRTYLPISRQLPPANTASPVHAAVILDGCDLSRRTLSIQLCKRLYAIWAVFEAECESNSSPSEREEKIANSLRQPDNLQKFKWKSSP
ncbi:hypothetical protein ACLOJK_022756 [Asimina triloba]